ncbi:MAG: hypothetical protein IJ460_05600 [Clostridia bacterium]|nr:hypothetical protein [Clostridia bacterium]
MTLKNFKKKISFVLTSVLILQSFLMVCLADEGETKREYISTLSGKNAKIFLAGDSTCENLSDNYFPREGWGMEIGKFFKKNVKIVNMAKGGKSTRSFLNNWDAPAKVYDTRMGDIKKNSSKGDWLFVQFGHNDYNNGREGVPTDPDKPDDNGDYTSYRKNLERFIDFADENKLNIVFLTSIHVLTSFSDGKLNSDGIDGHRKAMKEVAAAHGIPVLDVGEQHKFLVEKLGEKHAKEIYMFASRDEYPDLPPDVSVADTTHINQKGAVEVSKIVVNEIKKGAEAGDEILSQLYALVDTSIDTTPMDKPDTADDETENSENTDTEFSVEPGKNNAYVVFGKKTQTNHMSFKDGMESGITASSDPLYSENVTLDGVDARKMYASNVAYMNLDKSYYQPGDSRFLVMITYYDFGPDVGYFYFDYNSKDETLDEESRTRKRITITKPGITPRWSTVRLYIDDADFSGKQAYGADMSLWTRTYNAWAMVEIVNVDAMEREKSTSNVPVVNSVQAGGLEKLGLYSSKAADGTKYDLTEQLTKIEALRATLVALGYEKELSAVDAASSFSDVSGDEAKIVGLGEKLGIVDLTSDKKFEPESTETVNGALTYFLKYLRISGSKDYSDAYELAANCGLIINTDFVIFKDNPVIRDNFVAMAYNAIMIERSDTNRAPIGEMLDKGLFTGKDLKNTGLPALAAYEYYIPVKLPAKTYTDKTTGRKYFYMNLTAEWLLSPMYRLITGIMTEQNLFSAAV